MMKVKKLTVTLIGLMICIALLLTACGDQSTGNGGSQEPTKKPNGQTTGNTVSAPGQFPIVDEPVKLKVFVAGNPNVENFETNYSLNWLEEKTNVEIEWMVTSSADAGQRLTLLLATNAESDMPDVFLAGIDVTRQASCQHVRQAC